MRTTLKAAAGEALTPHCAVDDPVRIMVISLAEDLSHCCPHIIPRLIDNFLTDYWSRCQVEFCRGLRFRMDEGPGLTLVHEQADRLSILALPETTSEESALCLAWLAGSGCGTTIKQTEWLTQLLAQFRSDTPHRD